MTTSDQAPTDAIDSTRAIEIRPARRSDWSVVAALLTEASLPLAGADVHLDDFLVALDRERVIGVAGLEVHGHYGLLRSVAVQPVYRKRGVAGRLVDAIERHAAQRSVRVLCLLTTTATDYFAHRGFELRSRGEVPEALQASEELRGACPASAVFMQRRLST